MSNLITSGKRKQFFPAIRPKAHWHPGMIEDVFDYHIYKLKDITALTTAQQMVFRLAEQVVIISESNNPGMSVSNGMEHCIEALRESGDMTDSWCKYVVIEHYPEESFHRFEFHGKDDESFDLVVYDGEDINWYPFNRERLEQLIGEVFHE